MLHIILGILKWIGIVLLVLLLILLLVLAALLFVPVRYHVRAVKTSEEVSGHLQVSWLLRLILLRLDYKNGDRRPAVDLRLFGISIFRIRDFFAKRRKRKQEKRHQAANRRPVQLQVEEKAPEERLVSQEDAEVEKTPEERLVSEEDTEVKEAPEERQTEEVRESADLPQNETVQESSSDEKRSAKKEQEAALDTDEIKQEKRASLLSGIQKLWYRVQRICTVVRQIPAKTLQTVRTTAASLRKLWKTVSEIPKRAEYFLEFLEKYAVKELCGVLWEELRSLLRHYRPRKAAGWLRFGTGDPALTGELTGVLYLLLPARARLSVEPDFTETVFETDLELAGHIRAVHLVLTGVRLFRNKKLKRLIARIRKKGDSRDGR